MVGVAELVVRTGDMKRVCETKGEEKEVEGVNGVVICALLALWRVGWVS